MQKVCAPSIVRKQPEIFCFTLGMQIARSARLLVKGTRRSVTNRNTASACSRTEGSWPSQPRLSRTVKIDTAKQPKTQNPMRPWSRPPMLRWKGTYFLSAEY